MRRIKTENLNTPEAFDLLWRGDMERNVRQFDYYRFLAMLKDIRPGSRVIELGAGCSEFLTFCLNHLNLPGLPLSKATALDYSAWAMSYMAQIDPRVTWVVGNALDTGLEDGAFDAVLCGELIEHLDHPELLVREMARITAPDGFFRITTLLPHLQATDKFHVWEFLPDDLKVMFGRHSDRVELQVVGNYFVVTGRA